MAAVTIAALRVERQRVHDQITNLYWTFTRTARGKPPCVVRPDLYTRRAELDAAIKERTMPRKTKPTAKQLAAWRSARIANYADTRSPTALASMIVGLEDDGEHIPEFEYDDEWPERVAHMRVK